MTTTAATTVPFAKEFEAFLDASLRKRLRRGFVASAAFISAVVVWGGFVPLSSSVVAAGTVVVEGSAKKVQHPYGGVVSAINVKSGDRVKEGQILLSLDPVQALANHDLLVKQITENKARSARLTAERDGAARIDFPAELSGMPGSAETMAGEQKLFEARRTAREGQKQQLSERIKQLEIETESLAAQARTRTTEIAMMSDELARLNKLYDRYLIPENRVLTVKRDLVRLKSERESLIAQASKAQGSIAEMRLQIMSIDQNTSADSSRELRDVEARLQEALERFSVAADQLKRVDIRAPVSGMVHELSIHTIGGVAAPGDTLMMIVPDDGLLGFEVRISPNEIDQISIGQTARVKFPAFNQRTTRNLLERSKAYRPM